MGSYAPSKFKRRLVVHKNTFGPTEAQCGVIQAYVQLEDMSSSENKADISVMEFIPLYK